MKIESTLHKCPFCDKYANAVPICYESKFENVGGDKIKVPCFEYHCDCGHIWLPHDEDMRIDEAVNRHKFKVGRPYVYETFSLTDKYNLDDKTLIEYAMDAAVRRQELYNDHIIYDVKLKLEKNTKKHRIFKVYAIGVKK